MSLQTNPFNKLMRIIIENDDQNPVWVWKVIGDPNGPITYEGTASTVTQAVEDAVDSMMAYKIHRLRWNKWNQNANYA